MRGNKVCDQLRADQLRAGRSTSSTPRVQTSRSIKGRQFRPVDHLRAGSSTRSDLKHSLGLCYFLQTRVGIGRKHILEYAMPWIDVIFCKQRVELPALKWSTGRTAWSWTCLPLTDQQIAPISRSHFSNIVFLVHTIDLSTDVCFFSTKNPILGQDLAGICLFRSRFF